MVRSNSSTLDRAEVSGTSEVEEDLLHDLFQIERAIGLITLPSHERRKSISPPGPDAPIKQLVFGHDDFFDSLFKGILTATHRLYKRGLGTTSGGREGIVAALQVIRLLIQRLPISGQDCCALLEPLERVCNGFECLRDGYQLPEFIPATRAEGRPSSDLDPRRNELKIRCVLAAEALTALHDARPDEIVAERSIETVAHLGWKFPDREKRGRGFTGATVRNWRRRHNTGYRRWLQDFGDLDKDPSGEYLAHSVLDLNIDFMRKEQEFYRKLKICGQYDFYVALVAEPASRKPCVGPTERLRSYSNLLLQSLRIANLDRPIPVLGQH